MRMRFLLQYYTRSLSLVARDAVVLTNRAMSQIRLENYEQVRVRGARVNTPLWSPKPNAHQTLDQNCPTRLLTSGVFVGGKNT